MDEETKKVFNTMLEKPIGELTAYERAFLRARRPYMGKKTQEEYAEVLGEKTKPVEVKVEEVKDTNPHPSNVEDDGADE